MATKIEWVKNQDGSQGVSWNPFVGCTHAGSSGCDNCYAREMHNRRHKAYLASKKMPKQYAGSFDNIQLIDERMCLPLHWRKPKTIFVNSVSDLFHPEVPDDFIHCVYDVMGMAKQHTFIVCTKRPERIIPALYDSGYLGQGDYLPNVWHLCTVENQEWADKRIPELLRLKEYSSGWSVLGISVEPMLGPVEITKYLGGNNEAEECGRIGLPGCKDGRIRDRQRRASMEGCGQEVGSVDPKNPNHTLRPEESGKSNGQLLTSEGNGRLREGECFGAPFGMEAFQRPDSSGTNHQSQERKSERQFSGELGVSDVLGTNQTRCQGPGIPLQEGQYWKVFWVICGGETGPKARPMHPDWARSLRDQCQSAGVPFFFKQWGGFAEDTETPICRVCGCTDEEACEGGCWWVDDPEGGDLCSQCVGKPAPAVRPVIMNRVGKKAAGRLLDGREWNEMPEVR